MQKFFVALVLVTLFTSLLPAWAQEDGEICVAYNGNEICGNPTDVALVIQALSGETAPDAPQSTPVAASASANSTGWTVTYHDAAYFDRGDGTRFFDDANSWVWQTPQPELWPTPPNVPNPLVPDFLVVTVDGQPTVPNGIELVNGESLACEDNDPCHMPVAPLHYRLFTGDYNIPGYGECSSEDGLGCSVIFFNVGEVTADIEGVFHQGWTNHGRFWNGDELDVAIYATTSFIGNVMLHMNSTLNPNGTVNAGGNCSRAEGCDDVYTLVIVITGNEKLVSADTIMSR